MWDKQKFLFELPVVEPHREKGTATCISFFHMTVATRHDSVTSSTTIHKKGDI